MPSYKLTFAALAFALVSQAAPHVDSPPQLLTCQPVKLTYTGDAPFFVAIIPGGNPSAAPLENLGRQTAETLVWTPNIAVGTSVTISVTDASGETAYSSEISITEGSSTSCVGEDSAPAAGRPARGGAADESSSAPAAGAAPANTSGARAQAAAPSSSAGGPAGPAAAGLPSASASGAPANESSSASLLTLSAAGLASSLLAALVLA